MLTIKVDQIKPNTWNCDFMDPKERSVLKQRMNKDGPEKTLPVVVRKTSEDQYELVDGEHRWTIAKELGWETINALLRDIDDLQSRALCVSYNRLRGRLNWFKLYNIIKKDQDNNINITETYKEAISTQELQWLLDLGNLIPQAKTTLETAIKKYPEITLEQLHMIALFPATQQEILLEKFKNPLVIQALTQALTPFLNQQTQPPKETNPQPPLMSQETKNNQTNYTPQPTTNTTPTNDPTNEPKEQEINTQQTPTIIPQNSDLQKEKEDNPNSNYHVFPSVNLTTVNQVLKRDKDTQTALLVAVDYACDCNRQYHVNFKTLSVLVQKKSQLYEHINFTPRTFQVHCPRCNNDHEITVKGQENETVKILCIRCKPPRRGILDVNTGKATWTN